MSFVYPTTLHDNRYNLLVQIWLVTLVFQDVDNLRLQCDSIPSHFGVACETRIWFSTTTSLTQPCQLASIIPPLPPPALAVAQATRWAGGVSRRKTRLDHSSLKKDCGGSFLLNLNLPPSMSPIEVFGTGDQDFWSAKIVLDLSIVFFQALMIAWFTVVRRLNWLRVSLIRYLLITSLITWVHFDPSHKHFNMRHISNYPFIQLRIIGAELSYALKLKSLRSQSRAKLGSSCKSPALSLSPPANSLGRSGPKMKLY